MMHDLQLSLLGYVAVLVGLALLHLYFWMIGVGVAMVAVDEIVELYANDSLPLPSNPFARSDDDDQ